MRRRGRSDGNSRATIEQVATLAAVSTATASRALNHPETVSDALRERVEAAVTQLGYIRNQNARALSSLHSGLVGVLVPAIDTGHAPIVDAIQRSLGQVGYAMLLAATGRDSDRVVEEARAMAGREIEGVVLVGLSAPEELRALLDERRIPHVAVDAAHCAPSTASVEGDYCAAGETVARYLLALGHRLLAYLDGGTYGAAQSSALLAGLNAGLAKYEGTRRSGGALVLPASQAELQQCLVAPGAPTALVCADDLGALMALRRCAALGIAVPERVSIVGCGDFAFAQHMTPSLSTLRIPSDAMGRAAVDQLVGRNRGLPVVQAFPIKLVVRQSSGHAPT